MRMPAAWTEQQVAPVKSVQTRVTAFFDAQEILKGLTPGAEPTQHGTLGTTKEVHIGAPLDMSDEVAGAGICPVTGTQMVKINAGGHDVWLSLHDRIVLPVKDE